MSAELERFYDRLAERADAAVLPELDSIRDRARVYRRNRTVLGAAVTVLVVLAALVPWLTRGTPAPVVRPDVPPPITFVPFDPGAKPVIAFDEPPRFGMSITVESRSYVMWMGVDDSENVAVIDLATGQPLFAPVSVGKFGDSNGMQVARDAILLLTEQGYGNMVDTLIALDPGTGRELWRLPYSFNDTDRVLFDDTLVLTWLEHGKTDAIDLKTGAVRWTHAHPATPRGTSPIRTREQLNEGSFTGPSTPDDRRIVLRTGDGRVKVLDVDSGRVLTERDAPSVEARAGQIVVGDKLYLAGAKDLYEVDLAGTAPPRLLFNQPGKDTYYLTACGDRLFCLLNNDSVIAVDPAAAREAWRSPVPEFTRGVYSYGDKLLLPGPEGSMILGMDGKPLMEDRLRGVTAMWIDGGNLVVWDEESVSGLSLATGQVTRLGSLRFTGYPSWNRNTMVVPGGEGIFVLRYAG